MNNPAIWLICLFALAGLFVLLRRFSRRKRQQRRRERSYWPVASRKHGPSVKLAVDVGKPKRERKR